MRCEIREKMEKKKNVVSAKNEINKFSSCKTYAYPCQHAPNETKRNGMKTVANVLDVHKSIYAATYIWCLVLAKFILINFRGRRAHGNRKRKMPVQKSTTTQLWYTINTPFCIHYIHFLHTAYIYSWLSFRIGFISSS